MTGCSAQWVLWTNSIKGTFVSCYAVFVLLIKLLTRLPPPVPHGVLHSQTVLGNSTLICLVQHFMAFFFFFLDCVICCVCGRRLPRGRWTCVIAWLTLGRLAAVWTSSTTVDPFAGVTRAPLPAQPTSRCDVYKVDSWVLLLHADHMNHVAEVSFKVSAQLLQWLQVIWLLCTTLHVQKSSTSNKIRNTV